MNKAYNKKEIGANERSKIIDLIGITLFLIGMIAVFYLKFSKLTTYNSALDKPQQTPEQILNNSHWECVEYGDYLNTSHLNMTFKFVLIDGEVEIQRIDNNTNVVLNRICTKEQLVRNVE